MFLSISKRFLGLALTIGLGSALTVGFKAACKDFICLVVVLSGNAFLILSVLIVSLGENTFLSIFKRSNVDFSWGLGALYGPVLVPNFGFLTEEISFFFFGGSVGTCSNLFFGRFTEPVVLSRIRLLIGLFLILIGFFLSFRLASTLSIRCFAVVCLSGFNLNKGFFFSFVFLVEGPANLPEGYLSVIGTTFGPVGITVRSVLFSCCNCLILFFWLGTGELIVFNFFNSFSCSTVKAMTSLLFDRSCLRSYLELF